MVGRPSGKFLALLLIAATSSSCFAAIASAEGEEDTGGFGAFRLQGTNGYSVLVMAFSRPHFEHGEVAVWAARKNAFVTYLAPATVTATMIDADLGAAGTISVDFEAAGPPERVHAGCKRGRTISFEPGSWVGAIELEGEEGFTRVQTTRAQAMINPFGDLGCGAVTIGELPATACTGRG